ncbi:MAG: cytochrome c maturation protein CcmE [Spirochaetales bacterium]|nr:cytochrome c maturation protein CcmE [Leptospiraceae bacterium]MCP5482640.1 cytochrome c maturation protein CcmE [Spirochaetales bacterium]MCP5485021.1 cytochrome c maturation protein CcmE [Spirochaetales bacterium]
MQPKFLILAGIVIASLTALWFSGGQDSGDSLLIVDVDRVAESPAGYREREIRMRGFVQTGSILRYGDAADFVVEKDGRQVPVHFIGDTQLPDTFADGVPVRVDGQLDGQDRLIATRVEAKCGSKYEASYAGDGHPGELPIAP